jgi:hypothetical protein
MIVKFLEKYGLVVLLLIFSCAVKSLPSGGSQDLVAPYIKSISPLNGTTSLSVNKSIEINFNEMLDPNSIKSSIKIIPNDIDIKINSYGKKITIKPKQQWPKESTFKVKIKRGIADYKGNVIKKSHLLSYSTSDNLSSGFIKGKLFNTDSLRIYTVGLFELKDNSLVEYLSIEADSDQNFEFKNVKNGEFIVISLMHKIENIYNDVRLYPYGLLSQKVIIDDHSSYIDNLALYISRPNKNEQIVSIDMFNKSFGNIELTNSDKLPLINKNLLENRFGNIDSFILFDELADSIYLSFNINNEIESYKIAGNFKISSLATDSIPPVILDSFFDKNGYRLDFSEPIIIKAGYEPFTSVSSELDSLVLDYNYNDPKSINIKGLMDESRIIAINSSRILDFNDNELSSDIVNIDKSSIRNENPGNIYGDIIYNGIHNIIVELIDIESKEFIRVKADIEGKFLFENVASNKYKIWAYEDINSISEYYFNGTLIPLKLSASFGLYQELIEVRKNWDIEGIKIIINSEYK